jgi:hypothetical protein
MKATHLGRVSRDSIRQARLGRWISSTCLDWPLSLYLAGRSDVTPQDSARRPGGSPAERDVSTRQEQETRTGKLPGDGMSRAPEQQVTNLHGTV